MNSTTKKVQWSIEVGCLANRTYVNQTCSAMSNVYVGDGNYSAAYPNMSTSDSYTLYTTENNNYNIAGLWFGTPDSMTEFGYSGSSLECDIATNFRGLGLPWYEWNQFVSLLHKISASVSQGLECSENSCMLPQSCESYPELWSFQFTTRFDIATDTYFNVPFAAFSVTGTDQCEIFVQPLIADNYQLAENAVFGSMWLSNFVAYFEYDFSGISNTDSLMLFVSESAVNGTSISKVAPVNGTTSFSYTVESQIISVSVNSTNMAASINAELGY